jgi:hypothetical protein
MIPDAQENGTCATVWPLFKASLADLQVSDLSSSFDHAPPLALTDILLNSDESEDLYQNLHHCILRIIMAHGGESFMKFDKDLEQTALWTPYKIDLHQTSLHPLPAFDIDESTIVGGADVIEAIFNVLQVKKVVNWLKTVKIFCGDQLTIA